MERSAWTLRWLLAVAAAAVVAACASIGRPEGGPKDTEPPRYVKSTPGRGATRVTGSRITVDFDENVQVEDVMNKVVVSPAQRQTPQISASGRRLTVELRDTLVPDMTYTIDFSDAIKDLNEGNILDGFAMDFSTGETLDTLRISGMVFQGENLEPAQGMLVGAYTNLDDSAILTLPFERIAKTNQLGQFTLRGLKAVPYRLFAVNDVNRDYHWDRSEDVAFYDTVITPSVEHVMVSETIKTAAGSDTTVERRATRYMPDDVLLTWFNENYKAQYLADFKRADRNKLNLTFAAASDTLPVLKLINTFRAGEDARLWSRIEASPTLDTLTYWITDTALVATDSILIEARYMRTDTLDRLTLTTDTLKFFSRTIRKKKTAKTAAKAAADSVKPAAPTMTFGATTGQAQELNRGLMFRAGTPVATIDQGGVRMEILDDTTWMPVEAPVIRMTDSLRPMNFTAPYDWEEGAKYRLTIDSAAVRDVYGLPNKPLKHEFTVKLPSDYSTLTFNVEGLDGRPAVAQLLLQDNPVMTRAVKDGRVEFDYLAPGTYYARLWIDTDSSGTYTTGDLKAKRQPEETYYYPKKLNLKKNWDVEQTWNINELPVDLQKPIEITTNKPKKRNTDGREQDDDEEEDEFFNDPFMQNLNAADRLRNGKR